MDQQEQRETGTEALVLLPSPRPLYYIWFMWGRYLPVWEGGVSPQLILLTSTLTDPPRGGVFLSSSQIQYSWQPA